MLFVGAQVFSHFEKLNMQLTYSSVAYPKKVSCYVHPEMKAVYTSDLETKLKSIHNSGKANCDKVNYG
jgi:hypothetical protein